MSDNFIVCPLTGRQFARARMSDLKTCSSCGGLIDIREESWLDMIDIGAKHWPDACPERVELAPAPGSVGG